MRDVQGNFFGGSNRKILGHVENVGTQVESRKKPCVHQWRRGDRLGNIAPLVLARQLGSIPAEERARIKNTIEAGVADRSAITADMFDVVQRLVFKEMFYNTFQRFVGSSRIRSDARRHKERLQ